MTDAIGDIDVIILAGGKGTRMRSSLPKPLHTVSGKPAIQRIVESARAICNSPIVVVGTDGDGDAVLAVIHDDSRSVRQKEQRGTGHALMCALAAFENIGGDCGGLSLKPHVMVLPGDHPLVSAETLFALRGAHFEANAAVTLCTLQAPDFIGPNQTFSNYGRIRREAGDARGEIGKILGIVEVKDASESEKTITEVNVGYYCFNTEWLREDIGALTEKNAAGEFYLTDLVGIAVTQGATVHAYAITESAEAMGFNTPEQLYSISKLAQR
jgi:bifunctional UDP-N-acetylglucosamine pyrophosphorylase/glucosamine-1-phosphate N-acetyltransferase